MLITDSYARTLGDPTTNVAVGQPAGPSIVSVIRAVGSMFVDTVGLPVIIVATCPHDDIPISFILAIPKPLARHVGDAIIIVTTTGIIPSA
jgi:hypothetical protein